MHIYIITSQNFQTIFKVSGHPEPIEDRSGFTGPRCVPHALKAPCRGADARVPSLPIKEAANEPLPSVTSG